MIIDITVKFLMFFKLLKVMFVFMVVIDHVT